MLALPGSLAAALARDGAGVRLLVVRLGALGDVVRTLPAVRLLRQSLGQAHISWLVDERWQSAVAEEPVLDDTIPVERQHWRRLARSPPGWSALARDVGRLRAELRARQIDVALDFHGNLRSGILAWLSGAPVRIGYSGPQQREGNHWWMTHRVPARARRTPRLTRNLDLVRALGLADHPLPGGELALAAAGRSRAETIRAEQCAGRPFAIVAPGASARQLYKRPPAALLAAASGRLRAASIVPLIVWGPGEEPDARGVAALDPGAVLAPPTDLATLAALLGAARLFVGGDSGPMHLACASGCPVLALYGPTDPLINEPWGVHFRTVYPRDREYTGVKRRDRRHGFDGIAARQVVEAVDALLAETVSDLRERV